MFVPEIDLVTAATAEAAWPITETADAYDPLLDLIGDANIVLLGEATHGTQEFYIERARITKRLIEERGFNAVAVEADWPAAYLVNRYVRGEGEAGHAIHSLSGFNRFPRWLWRNTVVLDFIAWLRQHNDALLEQAPKTGFYGLDLYSLFESIEAVIRYLDSVDPEAAQRARYRYSCFDHHGEDPASYGYAAGFDLEENCQQAVLEQLIELQENARRFQESDGRLAADEYFFAEQNAFLVRNAEEYYRTMFSGRISSWNLRDRHMVETLERLREHLFLQDGVSKVVVWAHNSHIGDARATEMNRQGELNLGQLIRERHRRESRLIGFSTYTGTVTAASQWDGPAETMRVRLALPESYEALFHELRMPKFGLTMYPDGESLLHLEEPRLERAIGVIYRPDTERISHYFQAKLRSQFDAILHFDETTALEPLDRPPEPVTPEPETYPSAL